ncbi:MAG: putative rane protein [Proteiniphilum sp.]|jgi:hypothetical protein|nr:putative rane protein [Proteiniphilum sp.]
MRQLTIIPDTVPPLPFHLMRAEGDSLMSLPLQPHFGAFEYLPTDSSRLYFVADSVTDRSLQMLSGFHAGDPLPYSPLLQGFFFLLLLLCFLLFAIFYRTEGSSLQSSFRNLFSLGRSAPLVRKEQVTTTEAWSELFLIFQTVMIVSMLVFQGFWNKGISTLEIANQLELFVLIMGVVTFLTALKVLSYRLIGTFFLSADLKNWVKQYTRMLGLIGIVLFLPAACFIFLPEWKEVLLIFFVLIFLITRLVIIIGLLNIFVKNKIGGFYFFVYLCGTEIAPWLMLYKGVLSMINIAGINIV